MPEISRFYGIVIRMFHREHQPAHFHAFYAEHEMLVAIDTLAVIEGSLPPRALGMVMEWASLHQDELKSAWKRAQGLETIEKIAPLP
jgi:hypothetical protein